MDLEHVKREIGEEIAHAREKKGKTIEEIAETTRINPDYLRKIEQGDFEFLPRPYVVAYIKTFAGMVGLPGEALVQKWKDAETALIESVDETDEEQLARLAKSGLEEELKKKMAPPRRYYKELLGGGGIVFVVLLMLMYFSSNPKESSRASAEQAAGSTQTEQIKEIPFEQMLRESEARAQRVEMGPAQQPRKPLPRRSPLVLTLKATESVWMKIIIDGVEESEYTFQAGNEYLWEANESFQLIIGNAGGVRLHLNGKDLGAIGPSGAVARLLIGEKGVIRKRIARPKPKIREDTAAVPPRTTASADSIEHINN